MANIRRIVVDLVPMLPGAENGGAKIFIIELIRALTRLMPDTEFVLLTRRSSNDELALLDRSNVTRRIIFDQKLKRGSPRPDDRAARAARHTGRAGARTMLSRYARPVKRRLPPAKKMLAYIRRRLLPRSIVTPILANAPALFFCPFTGSLFSNSSLPTVVVVYDLLHRVYPEFLTAAEVREREANFRVSCGKTAVVAISEYVRSKVIECKGVSPGRVFAIPIRTTARLPEVEEARQEHVLGKLRLRAQGYFLYPANFWPHKNHEMLLTAFAMARKNGLSADLKLVCTGAPGPRADAVADGVAALGLDGVVLFPGFLSDVEFSALLKSARAMVFPSLYEGFGMPVLEAMAAGCPVACGNLASLPEVAGEAALLFDPRKPTEIMRAMLSIANDERLRADLVAKGAVHAAAFVDTDRMAREYMKVFNFVCSARLPNSRLGRLLTGYCRAGTGFLARRVAGRLNRRPGSDLEASAPPSGTNAITSDRKDAAEATRAVGSSPQLRVPASGESQIVASAEPPKVSIVTPSYNQGQFIERTIQSVLSQDWGSLEYVVFDGGSTDSTLSILERYGKQLRYVSRPDDGQADAVNKGIRETDGAIIGWLNSDDIYYPGAVRAAVEYFSAHPDVDVVYGMADHIDIDDRPFEEYPTEPWDYARLQDVCFLSQPAVFFRRSVVDRFGPLDKSLRYCMDYEFWLRLGACGARFGYLERKLAGSRLYSANKTLGSRVAVHAEINSMFRRCFGYVPYRWLHNYSHTLVGSKMSRDKHPNRFLLEVGLQSILAELRWNRRISGELFKIVYNWCAQRQ